MHYYAVNQILERVWLLQVAAVERQRERDVLKELVGFEGGLRAFSSGLSFLRPDPNAPMLLVEEVVTGEEVQRDDRVRDRTSSERRKTAGDATCMQTC